MPLHPTCLLLSLPLIALLVCGCVNGDAECIPEQRSMLLHLKHGFALPSPDVLDPRDLSGPPNVLLKSWKVGSNCCNWEGITCDPISGNVIGLDLFGQYISGSIDSDALFGLTSLQSLDLSRNVFENMSIPQPGFEKLKQLKRLDLRGAGFGGQIPIGISHLTSLKYLDLSTYGRGNLRLENPDFHTLVRNLSNLLVLDLGGVPLNLDVKWITTPLITSAPQLQELRLSSTNISGSLNKDFFQLKRLEYLGLSWNNISGVLPDFPEDCALQSLFLGGNKISGSIPDSIGKLVNLTYLGLNKNSLTGPIPRSLFALPLLQYLNLSYNLFTNIEGSNNISIHGVTFLDLRSNMLQGSIPLPPPSIQYLDISNNNFSGIVPPEFFSNLKGANYVSVANNTITGEIPPSICEAPLVILDLFGNLLNSSIPSCLLENSSLQVLNLGGNRLIGTIPQNIKEECQLKSIILSNNHLEGSLPRSLVNCSGLEVLAIANNHIVDSFPFWLGDHVGLQVLSLKANRFYGSLIPSKSQENRCFSSKLRILDLSSNHFHGNLSFICFSGWSVMRENNSLPPLPFVNAYNYNPSTLYENPIAVIKGQEFRLETIFNIFYNIIDFSDNSLEGDIPRVIGELQRLHVLNLSHNSLTGKIPSELGDLTHLDSLDLSTNKLSGEIPQHLTSFTSLGTLNLSSNNLVGSIPQGGLFSARSNNSFQDNPGLCGIPLSKQCGNEKQGNPTTMPPATTSDHSSSSLTYVIGLALSTGIGFGVGLSVVLVLQNVSIEFSKIVGR